MRAFYREHGPHGARVIVKLDVSIKIEPPTTTGSLQDASAPAEDEPADTLPMTLPVDEVECAETQLDVETQLDEVECAETQTASPNNRRHTFTHESSPAKVMRGERELADLLD